MSTPWTSTLVLDRARARADRLAALRCDRAHARVRHWLQMRSASLLSSTSVPLSSPHHLPLPLPPCRVPLQLYPVTRECNVFPSYFYLPIERDPGVVDVVFPLALTTFMYLSWNPNLCAPQLASECSEHHFQGVFRDAASVCRGFQDRSVSHRTVDINGKPDHRGSLDASSCERAC
ncbi:hypothetical protein DFH08DRAFT_865575 [Mycena albidolilacea]|uniref:Uncharacterized protein n=1 Tax=Mycena albidolilacea TaxID=1033008 RepID=A0AAD7ESW0_9AGAR|nr:hypothetical protein DFH08DRAFT_865575 [Mycena albidolilacea]